MALICAPCSSPEQSGSNLILTEVQLTSRLQAIAVGLFILGPGPVLTAAQGPITFNKHIAPILNEYCAPCHRPGESGPFPLLTYQDAKKHARQLAVVTKSRYMPPWLPEPGYGKFQDERRLSDAQIAVLERWVTAGEPQGDPADIPAPPKFTEGWQLGQPDLILTIAKPFALRADGEDVYRNLIFPARLDGFHYVRAIEIRVGNNKLVHHANVLIDREHTARALDGRDGQPGFAGMDLQIESEKFDPDGHFLFWKPGTVPFAEPDGMAWRMDDGTDLVLNMHLQPSGKSELVQPRIGLYFSDKPPLLRPMLIQLENDGAIDIPPGAASFQVSDDFTLPVDVRVLGVYPHAHYLGKDLQGFATLPDGTKKPLIWIRHWDQNWQAVFRYQDPIFLPKGTKLSLRYEYDNSDNNQANPNHPPKRVLAGNRAVDEMGHLWVQVLPAVTDAQGSESARLSIQESLMRSKLGKSPQDFSANYNLGAVLVSRGRYQDAEVSLRAAVRIDPANPTATNSLGAALQALGRVDEAVALFRESLRLRPDYPSAHYNLGNALLSQGQFEPAIANFREILRADPKDVPALEKLVTALNAQGNEFARTGKLTDAMECFREIVERNPDDADAYTNLGSAYAIRGDLAEAARNFERALQIEPGHEVARKNLERVRQDLLRRKK